LLSWFGLARCGAVRGGLFVHSQRPSEGLSDQRPNVRIGVIEPWIVGVDRDRPDD
jgi:hypothetical protein